MEQLSRNLGFQILPFISDYCSWWIFFLRVFVYCFLVLFVSSLCKSSFYLWGFLRPYIVGNVPSGCFCQESQEYQQLREDSLTSFSDYGFLFKTSK